VNKDEEKRFGSWLLNSPGSSCATPSPVSREMGDRRRALDDRAEAGELAGRLSTPLSPGLACHAAAQHGLRILICNPPFKPQFQLTLHLRSSVVDIFADRQAINIREFLF